MLIQWYPGHMAKARRMLIENLKLIDAVVELVDARAPVATRNPDFDDLFQNKTRVVLLNKSDLADREATKLWIRHFTALGISAGAIVSTGDGAKKTAISLIDRAVHTRVEAWKAKGANKVVRIMVVGIPNVGKSTFINRLAGARFANVGDKPGVTKGKQWVRITPYLELMDTPGLLWPKLADPKKALELAYIGSVKDDVMDTERLAANLLAELIVRCPAALQARYKKLAPDTAPAELLEAVCLSRGFVQKGGVLDTERAARIVLDEFRAGKIACVTFERPTEANDGKDT